MENIGTHIETKLKKTFQPFFLSVENESYKHHVPKNAQTHFRIEIVCAAFEGKTLLQRHRIIQECLKAELTAIQACSLHTLTQAEWEEADQRVSPSPHCVGHKP